MKKEPAALTCALYGWEHEVDMQRLLEFFERIANERSIVLASTEIKLRRGDQFRKPRFSAFKAKLLSGEWDDIEEVALYPSNKKFEEIGHSEIQLIARLGAQRSLVIAIDEQSASHNGCDFLHTAREAIVFVGPIYGFIADIPYRMSPALYAAGIARNPPNSEARQRIGDFQESYTYSNKHLKGKLRDVYEINILSRQHLERDVLGKSFREWQEERQLGTFEQVTNTAWIWSLGRRELPTARTELLRAGALIATV